MLSMKKPDRKHARQAAIGDSEEPSGTHGAKIIKPLKKELQLIPLQKLSSVSQFILDTSL